MFKDCNLDKNSHIRTYDLRQHSKMLVYTYILLATECLDLKSVKYSPNNCNRQVKMFRVKFLPWKQFHSTKIFTILFLFYFIFFSKMQLWNCINAIEKGWMGGELINNYVNLKLLICIPSMNYDSKKKNYI